MSLLVELTAAEERTLADEAARRRMDAARLARLLISDALPDARPAAPAGASDAELNDWLRRFDEWVLSHDPATPVPPPEAYERENLYADRV